MIISVKELVSGKIKPGQEITLRGWVRTRRDSKAGLSFINLTDGSCFTSAQIIAESNLDNYDQILNLTAGCSFIAHGVVVESPAAGQALEIKATKIEICGMIENPETYPMSPKRHSLEHLRTHGHLRPRSNLIGAVSRVRNTLAHAIHNFFNSQEFLWISTPIITASDTEGAGELFRVSTLDLNNLPRTDKGDVDFKEDFFGKESFLTVSGQLNVETYACALSKVYTFGPTFRAENSNTTRHLAEFWMVEPEVAFNTLTENALLAEGLIKHCFRAVLDNNRDDLEFFTQHVNPEVLPRLESLVDKEIVTINYTDAIEILLKTDKKFEFPVSWGIDLSSEHERYLAEEHFKSIVIVKNYPKEIKAFYMKQNDDGKTVAAMDVLAPGIGEIIGGSERETDLAKLHTRMDELGLNPEDYSWYLDLRRYGTVPHSGFGLGFERFVCYVTGVENVRDAIPFPRSPGQVAF